jgi:hypothetical protein
MKRTHTAIIARPERTAPATATANIVTGCENRIASSAPAHNPTYEAPHARTGVRSHPNTTSRWASQRGMRPLSLSLAGQGGNGQHRQRHRETQTCEHRKRTMQPGEFRDHCQEYPADQRRCGRAQQA